MSRRRQRGLTLIELLVVLTILAFASALVVLSGPPERSSAREEAERFAARMRAAWEDSIIDGAAASVALSARAYRIERYENGAWRLAPASRRFSERLVKDNVAMTVLLDDPAEANKAGRGDGDADEEVTRIVLDPIGATTPFVVEFADRRERWRVSKSHDETIVVARVDRS